MFPDRDYPEVRVCRWFYTMGGGKLCLGNPKTRILSYD
jgi:hypothetical protein